MKTAGMLLDFTNDSCRILGRYIKLQNATSEHYSVFLTNMLLEVERPANVVLHCEALKKCSRMEKRRKAKKLHRQFVYTSKEKLIFLDRGSKASNDKEFLNLIREVCDSFYVCLRFRKPTLQPVIELTLGNRFNDTMSDFKGTWT